MEYTRLKMNLKEQTFVIFENFSKMLFKRKIISNIQSFKDKLEKKYNVQNIYDITDNNNSITLIIKFKKIAGIKKGSDIETTLIKSNSKYKFLVISDYTNKTYTQSLLFSMELFKINELLTDIPSNPLVPEHILLTPEQKEEFNKSYSDKNLAKISSRDVMVRYLGAKNGDIIKIIRPTINSGESVYYRRVINI